MAMRTQQARRRTDRIEDVAVWILIAAGLLVVCSAAASAFGSTMTYWSGAGWRAPRASRPSLGCSPTSP
jgi:hypothetical protein